MLDPQVRDLLREYGPSIHALNWVSGGSFVVLACLALVRRAVLNRASDATLSGPALRAQSGRTPNSIFEVLGSILGGDHWAKRDRLLSFLVILARIALLVSVATMVVYFGFVPL
jgi:hypothetical protein